MQKATAIIAAGGAGLRMGASTPKQFTELLGVPILIHTIRAFRQVPAITAIIVVVPAEHREHTLALLTRYHFDDHCTVVNGGKLRQDSVRIGLAQVTDDSTLVAVHDGARPLIAPADIQRCLDAAATHGAAIMAVPVKDTLKAVAADTTIRHTVEREGLWQAQTPQVVRAGLLKEAFAKADQDGFVGTDEASLLEHGGWQVSMVEGSETNLKITRPDDLLMAEALLMQKQPSPQMRIGHGFDAHRLVAGRPLILGGMEIPHELGLLGHSDADALTMPCATPSWAPLALATSAAISRTATRSTRGSPASRCLRMWPGWLRKNISACVTLTSPWWPSAPSSPPIFPPCKKSLPRPAGWSPQPSTSRPPPRNRWATPAGKKESAPTPWC